MAIGEGYRCLRDRAGDESSLRLLGGEPNTGGETCRLLRGGEFLRDLSIGRGDSCLRDLSTTAGGDTCLARLGGSGKSDLSGSGEGLYLRLSGTGEGVVLYLRRLSTAGETSRCLDLPLSFEGGEGLVMGAGGESFLILFWELISGARDFATEESR